MTKSCCGKVVECGLKPIGENVLVRPIEEETMTASGIVIPDTASKEKPMRGEILAIGEGSKENPAPKVAVGDIVVFTKYAPTEIKINGEELYILDFKSLLAVEK
jgi:chaperonin GroES